MKETKIGELIFGNWEYHPHYGEFSRLVWRVTGKDSMDLIARQYKTLEGEVL